MGKIAAGIALWVLGALAELVAFAESGGWLPLLMGLALGVAGVWLAAVGVHERKQSQRG